MFNLSNVRGLVASAIVAMSFVIFGAVTANEGRTSTWSGSIDDEILKDFERSGRVFLHASDERKGL